MTNSINTDYWGNGLVWLPFGKAGDVKPSNDGRPGYQVNKDDILAEGSIATLDGIPVYVGHPASVLANNQNPAVGVCLGQWRESADGLGGEVLAKITDKTVLSAIESGELVETSPTYVKVDGIRVFNHIGLFKTGMARGTDMTIQSEGQSAAKDTDASIAPSATFEVYDLNPSALLSRQVQNYQKLTMNDINNQILEMLGALSAKVEMVFELAQKDAADDAVEALAEGNTTVDDSVALAFAEGLAAGEVLSTAKSHGYQAKSEISAIENVSEAKKFIVGKAFASLKTEGYSEQSLNGAYGAAIAHLSTTKTEAKTTAEAPTVILSEGNTLDQIKRLPIK
jgi:hypothetical protein